MNEFLERMKKISKAIQEIFPEHASAVESTMECCTIGNPAHKPILEKAMGFSLSPYEFYTAIGAIFSVFIMPKISTVEAQIKSLERGHDGADPDTPPPLKNILMTLMVTLLFLGIR